METAQSDQHIFPERYSGRIRMIARLILVAAILVLILIDRLLRE